MKRTILICSSVLLFMAFFACAADVRKATPPGEVKPTLTSFTVFDPTPGFLLPPIVLQYDSETQTGADWDKVGKVKSMVRPPLIIGAAAAYLREGIERMTGEELEVVSTNDLSRGIVLTLLKYATPDIRDNPAISKGLAADPNDAYSANEAFVIYSEKNRLLLVANTAYGLLAAVTELLEMADYEVLGMGPNWTYVPDYRNRRLAFSLNHAERPGFYIRNQWATTGQSYGVGTITTGLTDPDDEPVSDSYWRWRIGTRMEGRSMPNYPGHALQAYHVRVLNQMSQQRLEEGFLASRILVTTENDRPEATAETSGWLWVNADTNAPVAKRACSSDGKVWKPGNRFSLDLSSPFVREIILAELIQRARRMEQGFDDPPNNLLIFGMDPEDGGGYDKLDSLSRHPNWYPEYLAAKGIPFGQPYVLHGHNNLDQPKELWDASAASDHVYGLANYLLRELDAWVDNLPEAERALANEITLKDRVRCSFYCYNFHDVPPNFNLDPRIRVMIAGYPKHRGRGKWERFASQEDLAHAFKKMLPREPSADRRISSLAFYHDQSNDGLPSNWDASAAAISADYSRLYDSGCRALSTEVDFNFGKYGLAYYLTAKMLWNPSLTAEGLDALRDRWLQRAYGSAWQTMKAYYDFMLKPNFTINGPNFWAEAIRLIDTASKQLDPVRERAEVRRLDDLKVFWYYHYLMASEQLQAKNSETLTFLWKGQMSYMVAMHGPVRSLFPGSKGTGISKTVGEALAAGPAHYTHAETQAWWARILDFWPLVNVASFNKTTLADGSPAAKVDLNNLVGVKEFRGEPDEKPFATNCGTGRRQELSCMMVAARADDPIGFQMYWPDKPEGGAQYHAMKVLYGADIWDAQKREWVAWLDPSQTSQESEKMLAENGKSIHVVKMQHTAPRAGVYRFNFARAGDLCNICSLGFDPVTDKAQKNMGFTFNSMANGLSQSSAYFYIPKGTRSLDFEVWDRNGSKTLFLHKGLPSGGAVVTRKLDVGKRGPHVIPLEPGEDGTVAMLFGRGFAFPYLYSVPLLWAKSPGALLVPRAIAIADGLTIVE